jgi:hypothetical protein
VTRVIERTAQMRFASGSALLNHHFIKLGLLDGWRDVGGEDASTLLPLLQESLDTYATQHGGLSLAIPMAYVETVAIESERPPQSRAQLTTHEKLPVPDPDGFCS